MGAECHYAEHRCAKCRCSVHHAEGQIFNVILNVIYTKCRYAEHRYSVHHAGCHIFNIMLNLIYTKCHYAEYFSAECHCSVRHAEYNIFLIFHQPVNNLLLIRNIQLNKNGIL